MSINAIQQATKAIAEYEAINPGIPLGLEKPLYEALNRLRYDTLEVMGVLAQAMLDDEVGERVREIATSQESLRASREHAQAFAHGAREHARALEDGR